jgi:hemin uptake protein HemP
MYVALSAKSRQQTDVSSLPKQPLGGPVSDQDTVSGDPASFVQSNTLLRGQKSVAIQHNGSVYRLQATKLGKLILTK